MGLDKWYWLAYLHGRNGDRDVKNGLVETVQGGDSQTYWEVSIDIYTVQCVN